MQLQGYSNLSKLASGGMANVYKARQLSLNRTVAVKFLSAEHLWDEEARSLFNQESLVIAQLNHPNIIHIIDRGFNEKGRPYFVMEYVQGSELSQVMQQEKLTLNSKINLLMQILKGLAAAHKNGVIHRDIKPSNLLVDTEGHLKILDFGIALIAASGKPEDIVGTPDYMSPEQFSRPEAVTQLSDLYSFGVIMFEMFLGQLPPGNDELLQNSLTNLPQDVASIIEKCLQKNPQDRPASADDIRLDLLKITQGSHLNPTQRSDARTALSNLDKKFVLLDVIKKTDFGSVYLFEDKAKHNLFVIKKRTESFAGYQEANQLQKLEHPNVINIYGTSKNQNAFIIVMEHLEGGSLQDRLVRTYTLNQFIPVATAICTALNFAHSHNLAHGNLRPSNILYDDKHRVKLTDFGLEEHYHNSPDENWYQPSDQGRSSKSRDMYSAGAIFYRMLCGENVNFKNKRVQNSEAFTHQPRKIRKLICNMMEEDNPDQYMSFDEVLTDLNTLVTPETKAGTATQTFKLVLLVLASCLLGGIIYMLLR